METERRKTDDSSSQDLPNMFYFYNKTNKFQKQTSDTVCEVFARTSLTDKKQPVGIP